MKKTAKFLLLIMTWALLWGCAPKNTPTPTPPFVEQSLPTRTPTRPQPTATTTLRPTATPTTGPTATPSVIAGAAQIDSIQVLLLESFPVQARAVIQGNLPDGCTQLNQVSQQRQGNVFHITLTTARPTDRMCTLALVPFEQIVPLDVLGLPAGTYTVIANDAQTSFKLDADNAPAPSSGKEKETIGLAAVSDVEIRVADSGQIEITASGDLPDGCSRIAGATQTVRGREIVITLNSARSIDRMCTMAIVPFRYGIILNTEGLTAGAYTILVNDVRAAIQITADQIAPPAPSASCPVATQDTAAMMGPSGRYCLVFPKTFVADQSQTDVLVISSPDTAGRVRPAMSITARPARGQTLEQIIQDLRQQYPNLTLEFSETVIAGERALITENLPGTMPNRQAFFIHADMVYTLVLDPIGERAAPVIERVEGLWKTVVESWTWLPTP